MAKTKYYAICIEFQEIGSPHGYSFISIFKAVCIENEATYIGFIEKTINAQFPNHLNNPELFKSLKTYQVHDHCRTFWEYNKNECRFSYGRCFTQKTVIAKPLDSKCSND